MKKTHYIKIFLGIISVFFSINNVSANNYLSEPHNNIDSCNIEKKQNNSLYPGYTRSECFESEDNFYYNICETNHCIIPSKYSKSTSQSDNPQVQKLAKVLEDKLEALEADAVIDWSGNFQDILEELKNKYQYNPKSFALMEEIEAEFKIISKKQIEENSLCKNEYGYGWQESKEFKINTNNIVWYDGDERFEITCEYFLEEKKKKSALDNLIDETNWIDSKEEVVSKEPIFLLTSSKLTTYLNKVILDVKFSQNIDNRNILLRSYSMYEYHEKYLKDFSEWNYSEKTFQFSDTSKNVLGIWFTEDERYTFEIYDEDNNAILAQYKIQYDSDSSQREILKEYPVRNLFDGNKNRGENYSEILQEVQAKDVHNFFKTAEVEMKSKIRETQDFIYFNETYAITKERYYGNQIYSTRVCPNNSDMCSNGQELSSICPVWYKLEHDTIHYNPYERQLIWYYLNNNKGKFFQHNNPNWVLWNNLIATPLWVWDKFDEYFVRKVDLERIKAESQTRTFMNREFVFVNPGHSLKNLSLYNQYHYLTDYGSSYKLWTKISALCEKKDGEINTPNDKELFDKKLTGVINVQEDIIMKESQYEWGYPLLLSYAYLKLKWYFDENTTFFKPYKKDFNNPFLYFAAKE